MTSTTLARPVSNGGSEPPTDVRRRWHALHAAEAIAALETDASSGLPPEEARRRLDRFGENALREPTPRSLISVFAHQFKSPLIYLLFVAAGIALVLGRPERRVAPEGASDG